MSSCMENLLAARVKRIKSNKCEEKDGGLVRVPSAESREFLIAIEL